MVLRILPSVFRLRLRDSHPLWSTFPDRSASPVHRLLESYNPGCFAPGLGSSAFARHYSRNSFLFLGLLRCFSSPGSLPLRDDRGSLRPGFPIRTSPAITPAHDSPALFAVYHVLLRHLTPRHPPCALIRFAPHVIRRRRILSRFLACVTFCLDATSRCRAVAFALHVVVTAARSRRRQDAPQPLSPHNCRLRHSRRPAPTTNSPASAGPY